MTLRDELYTVSMQDSSGSSRAWPDLAGRSALVTGGGGGIGGAVVGALTDSGASRLTTRRSQRSRAPERSPAHTVERAAMKAPAGLSLLQRAVHLGDPARPINPPTAPFPGSESRVDQATA